MDQCIGENKFMKGWMQRGGSVKRVTGQGRRRVTEEAAMGKRERRREQGEGKERERLLRCRESQRAPRQQRNGGERRLGVDGITGCEGALQRE